MRDGNVEELCRLTQMLPEGIADLQSACEHSPLGRDHLPMIEDLLCAHHRVEKYLERQIDEVRGLLMQYGTARRTMRAYGKSLTAAQLDNRG